MLSLVAAAGCASAGPGNSIIGGLDGDAGVDRGGRTDANDFPSIDASLIDAPPNEIALSEVTSQTISRMNTFFCADNSGGNANATAQNSYYRIFALGDFGITTTLHVTQVDFGVEHAKAGTGGAQPAQVQLATYGAAPTGDTLDPAQFTSIGSPARLTIPDGDGTRVSVPITADVSPTARLVVELDIPNGAGGNNEFTIGSNPQGESAPGYTSASDCGFTVPTTMSSIAVSLGDSEADIILSVTGTR